MAEKKKKVKFNLGDIVVAHNGAPYGITRDGWKGLVVSIDDAHPRGETIQVSNLSEYDSCAAWVNPIHFDLVRHGDPESRKEFHVGDYVIGNERANCYGVTRQGWIGEVLRVENDGRIRVSARGDSEHFEGSVLAIRFDLYEGKVKEERKDEKTELPENFTNAQLYAFLFGCTHAGCPSSGCDECPGKHDCKKAAKWWDSPYSSDRALTEHVLIPAGLTRTMPERNGEHTKTRKKGLEGLCEEYNYSDSAGLKYIADNNLCTTDEQKATLEVLSLLNELIYVYNSEKHREVEYRARYTQLLKVLGVRLDKEGNAYVKKEVEK